MKLFVGLLAALVAFGGCGSTTTPDTNPPDVSGSYRGAVVLFAVQGATTGDTLEAEVNLAQSQAALSGTWRVWARSGADSVWGTVEQGQVVTVGSDPATWQVNARLRVARPDCDGGFDVRLGIVSIAPAAGRALQGTFSGSAGCFRGGGAQSGELTVILGATSRPRIRSGR